MTVFGLLPGHITHQMEHIVMIPEFRRNDTALRKKTPHREGLNLTDVSK